MHKPRRKWSQPSWGRSTMLRSAGGPKLTTMWMWSCSVRQRKAAELPTWTASVEPSPGPCTQAMFSPASPMSIEFLSDVLLCVQLRSMRACIWTHQCRILLSNGSMALSCRIKLNKTAADINSKTHTWRKQTAQTERCTCLLHTRGCHWQTAPGSKEKNITQNRKEIVLPCLTSIVLPRTRVAARRLHVFPNDSQAMSLPRLSSSHIRSMTAKNHPKQPASFHIESTAGCERIKLETYLTITLQLTNEYAARMLQLSVQQARKNLLNCQMSDSTDHYNPWHVHSFHLPWAVAKTLLDHASTAPDPELWCNLLSATASDLCLGHRI